jgi:NADPH:quinone reductase-like Zn-dependent oxidoreductase
VQIAKAHGAHVIATASAAKHQFLRGIGADEVVDYRTVDVADAVRHVDIVLDTVGGGEGPGALRCLRPGGLLVTVVERANEALRVATEAAGMRFAGIAVEPDYVGLEALAALVAADQLRPCVEDALPLAHAAKAHVLVESGRTMGKIVLTVQP